MKTRIVSGLILALIVGVMLLLGFTVSFYFVTAFICILAAIGAYELLHNAAGITDKLTVYLCSAATAFYVVIYNVPFRNFLFVSAKNIYSVKSLKKIAVLLNLLAQSGKTCFTIGYVCLAVIIILAKHEKFDISKIFIFIFTPVLLGFSFSCIERIIESGNGIYYLLLLITFSCICDMGAYFTGVTIGKHKLCPAISPKKTIEGVIGGIVLAIIVSVVLVFAFSMQKKLLFTCIFTVPFCALGICGDLFASIIKRKVGIKDYGNLIPGHGGVLDRFDSILLIAPAMLVIKVMGLI